MLQFLKRSWLYLIIVISCIAGYFITSTAQSGKLVQKEIIYTSDTVSEVFMVWGINYSQLAPKKYWPSGSFEKDSLVYTPLPAHNNKFAVTLRLPHGTLLNYWMLQKKDKKGNDIEVWDSGGDTRQYFSLSFNDEGIFKAGYFIFLAGFLPLLIYFFRMRGQPHFPGAVANVKINDYVPQFDSIRAIAVMLVIVYHWFEGNKILNFIPNGPLGVNIFFVLSGFLITGILLKARKQVETKGLKRSTAFANFYIRRTLRIFPIYYLVLILFWLINDPAIRSHAIYYFTYTSNYLFYFQEDFPARLAHLWSLAVEEQFYILWPWLMLLVNKKFLPYLISLFIIIGISSNYIFTAENGWAEILTPTCFDAFAIGAALSYIIAYRPDIIPHIQSKFRWIFLAACILFILSIFGYSFLPRRTCHSLLAIVVIYYCLFKKNNSVMNYVLDNKLLLRIGKISYGVYLYHLFAPELWNWIIKKFAAWDIDLFYNSAMPERFKSAWLVIQHFSFLMLLCVVSWNLIEKPFNRLKRFFENKTPAAIPG